MSSCWASWTAKIAEYGKRIEKGEGIRLQIKQRHAQSFEDIRQAQIDVSVAQERVRTMSAQREEHRAQQERCDLLQTQIEQNLRQIDSQLAGARDTQAGKQKTNEEMNKQTAALSDELYEKREKLDALREETQNLRVLLATCERDANAFKQEGLRIRREQDNLGVQIGQAHEKREALTLQHQQSTQLLGEKQRGTESLCRKAGGCAEKSGCASGGTQRGAGTDTPNDAGNRQPARNAGDGYG